MDSVLLLTTRFKPPFGIEGRIKEQLEKEGQRKLMRKILVYKRVDFVKNQNHGRLLLLISVVNPFHFDTDPYLRIRFVERRIRIRPRIEKD